MNPWRVTCTACDYSYETDDPDLATLAAMVHLATHADNVPGISIVKVAAPAPAEA